MPATILIVEDNLKIANILRISLQEANFKVTCLNKGHLASPWARKNNPDLILLDVMLPGRNGLTVCKEIRTFSDVPIIMISGCSTEADRLLGFIYGVDDYICKPFSPREVVIRVKNLLRRTNPQLLEEIKILKLDSEQAQASLYGKGLKLSDYEFQLLNTLVSNPGRIYTRNQLAQIIYGEQQAVSDRTIDSLVKRIRKKISAISPELELIHAVYGVGYKYDNQ